MLLSSVLSLLAVRAVAGGVGVTEVNGRPECTVTANGNQTDDVPNILDAFAKCGHGGNVIFPEDQSYWIATKLNPVVNDVQIEWHGQWTVSSKHFI